MSMDELTLRLVVASRTKAAEGVIEICLSNPDNSTLPPWEPGAHIDIILDDEMVRQYSLCGDITDNSAYRVAVLLDEDGRGGSRRIHQELHEGRTVTVRGPRNHFELQDANTYLFVAGGIGITPMLPMIQKVSASGADWHLVYGGRTRATMAYLDTLDPFSDRVTLVPRDEVGRFDLPAILDSQPLGTMIYCCGPERLLEAAEQYCVLRPSFSLRTERFAPKIRENAVDAPFSVELADSKLSLQVPANRSLVEVLRDAGIDILTSCEEGTCGTCETKVLAGTPDHRDSILCADEQDEGCSMMVCVSRSLTPTLTLQL